MVKLFLNDSLAVLFVNYKKSMSSVIPLKQFPKSIIISGTARNVGKTTFACQLIEKYKPEKVIAIKISPHFHSIEADAEIIEQNEDFVIVREHKKESSKDSARMLNAGASEVYFIMTLDNNLLKVVNFLSTIVDTNSRIIIESAAIRRYILPQKFYVVYNNDNPNIKNQNTDLEKYIDEWINGEIVFLPYL